MNIDELIHQAKASASDPAHSLTVPKSWAQGRTLFGGLSAALLYAALREKVSQDRCLRSLTTNFIGPLEPDLPFRIDVEVLREGRNVSQVVAKAVQNDQVAVFCQACFGVDRESKIRIENHDKHQMAPPKKAAFIPQIPKVTPKFLQHMDLAMVEGGLPFTGKKESNVHGWMRFKEAPEQVTDAHLIALIDAWPPTILQMLRWPAPASTMSWNLEFIHPHSPVAPDEWFAYQAQTRQAADGYCHSEANIWDSKGELVAISRQIIAVFD
ncbi:thioesterase family protein [Aliiglaciecola sp. CAU 1673]|uniref:acyl-CoA thioesterase n=1 Tax=Aliiglaciecola sp. CAU 1673 TaxID=3032595 RepID=UPI0023D9CACC|nr:thioesterase family protein [Aliiglaciecola sp. CAU 1673]MDF2177703.1 thioesterase family protein [Aliiglaciecola sp. CAU 1673]